MSIVLITTFVACYFVGGIPFGFIIGKWNGIDIRASGSGNIGATNILRVCGKKWGYTCFLLDAMKGLLPVLISRRHHVSHEELASIAAAVGVVCGHIWSPYLRFKGGKGVATSAGALLGVAPIPVIIIIFLWYIVFTLTRYVSLASIVAAAALPVVALIYEKSRPAASSEIGDAVTALFAVLALIIIFRHRTNIQRLLNGTENRFVKKDNA